MCLDLTLKGGQRQAFHVTLSVMINNFILHCTGIRLGLFTPDQAFDVVARKQIEKLRKPCLTLIQLVCTELYSIASSSVTKVQCLVLYISVYIFVQGVEALFSVHIHTLGFVCFLFHHFCLVCTPCLFCFHFVLEYYELHGKFNEQDCNIAPHAK